MEKWTRMAFIALPRMEKGNRLQSLSIICDALRYGKCLAIHCKSYWLLAHRLTMSASGPGERLRERGGVKGALRQGGEVDEVGGDHAEVDVQEGDGARLAAFVADAGEGGAAWVDEEDALVPGHVLLVAVAEGDYV